MKLTTRFFSALSLVVAAAPAAMALDPGTYTIGAEEGADYATFAAAIDALGSEVTGPITFQVQAGTYSEDVNIPQLTGTSADAQVIFTSASGEPDVIMKGSGTPAKKVGLLNITDAAYLTVENFVFQPDAQYYRLVQLNGACKHFTLHRCNFIQPTLADVWSYYTIYTEAVAKQNGTNADNITITDCNFTGGYIAIDVQGSQGYVAYEHLQGVEISGCRFTDCGSKAIYLVQCDGVNVHNNVITASDAVTETGYSAIDVCRLGAETDIHNNIILNQQSVYSNGMDIRMDAGGTAESPLRVYNNAIALTASPNGNACGICVATDTHDLELAHNTISIAGNGGNALYFDRIYDPFAAISLRNNIFSVTATNGVVLDMPEAIATRITEQGNAILSGSGNAVFGTLPAQAELAGMTAAEPQFTSGVDMHLLAPITGVTTTPVTYASTDLEGTERSAETPTPGAYEYATEPVAETPAIMEGYPQIVTVEDGRATLSTAWTLSGTQYAVVLPGTETAPTAEALLETTGVDFAAETPANTVFTDLKPETEYIAYFLLNSPTGGNSAVVASPAFTTPRHIEPLQVIIDAPEEINSGEKAEMTAGVEGGTEPYSYSWRNRMDQEVSTEATFSQELTDPEIYILTVTDADGTTAQARACVTVWGGKKDADFSDNALAPSSAWYGYDYGDSSENYFQCFYSGSFKFSNCYMPEYMSWTGFAYSNQTATGYETLFPDQFNSAAGGGVEGTPFALAYSWDASTAITPLRDNEKGAELASVMLTNSAYAYNNMTNGDGFSEPFKDGDYIKVIFTGDDPEGQTVEYYLGDYRDGATFVSNKWETVSLLPLGKHVHKVSVTFESSNPMTPTYVCLDNLKYADQISIDTLADEISDPVVSTEYYTLDGIRIASASQYTGICIRMQRHASGRSTTTKMNK